MCVWWGTWCSVFRLVCLCVLVFWRVARIDYVMYLYYLYGTESGEKESIRVVCLITLDTRRKRFSVSAMVKEGMNEKRVDI